MQPAAPTVIGTPITDADFLRSFARQPSGERFHPFVERYLPLVYSSALRRTRDESQAAEVTKAVFLALAYKARQLPRKTVLADWLFKATRFACPRMVAKSNPGAPASLPASGTTKTQRQSQDPLLKREDNNQDGPPCPLSHPMGEGRSAFGIAHPEAPVVWTEIIPHLDEAIDRLPQKARETLLLRVLLDRSWEESAQTLRTSEKRAGRRLESGLAKLARHLRKKGLLVDDQALALACSKQACSALAPASLPSEIEAAVDSGLAKRPALTPLVRRTLRAIYWAPWRRRLKRAAISFAILAVALTLSGFYLASLWRSGRLMAWFIVSDAVNKAKAVPGLTQPARPWPTDAAHQLLDAHPVRKAADLYHLTNVWLAHLKFTPAAWEALEPGRVPPVPKLLKPDGEVVLRNPKARRSGLAGALGYDFDWARADFEFGAVPLSNVGARFKGNGTYLLSLYGAKRSFKVALNKFTKGQRLGEIDEFNFANLIDDRSYMSDALAYEFFRDAGVPAPRTAYAWLTESVAGRWDRKPLGLYLLVESLGGAFASEHFGSKKAPIFKPVTYQLFQDLGTNWSAYANIYDLKTRATEDQRQQVIDFSHLVSHADDQEFAKRLADFLDLDEFARFLAGLVLLSSYDGFLSDGQNFYLYLHPQSNKFGFIPWDLDHAWGAFYLIGRPEERERASIWHPWVGHNRFLERVMAVDEFHRIYRARLEELLQTLFVPSRLSRHIDELAAAIRSPIAAESSVRLQWFEQAISTQRLPAPTKTDPTGPNRPVHQLKHFIEARAKSVQQQLAGKSKGVIPGRKSG